METITAPKNPYLSIITPENNSGNAMSPPPNIAVLVSSFVLLVFLSDILSAVNFDPPVFEVITVFWGAPDKEYGIANPANTFSLFCVSANVIMCFVCHTAMIS